MPYVKVYLHFVWSTKNRYPFLNSKEIRKKVWQHILENSRNKNIFIDFIGGYTDHCHCLLSMGVDQTIKDLAQLIKGESAYWINKQKLCSSHFNWQNDYFVASVSESRIDATRNYIKSQEEHHKIRTFKDEYNDFLKKHGFEKFED